MRFALSPALLLPLILLAAPVAAQDVHGYSNGRFGYSIDIPATFALVRKSDNGDGRSYRDGATRLLIWGANIIEGDFESAAQSAIGFVEQDGWAVTYQSVTPSWASFSGVKGQRIVYERMIALCEDQYAAFRLEYSAVDMTKLDPVVNELVRSLAGPC